MLTTLSESAVSRVVGLGVADREALALPPRDDAVGEVAAGAAAQHDAHIPVFDVRDRALGVPTRVKLANTGMENGGWSNPASQPTPLQPSASKPCGSLESDAGVRSRIQPGGLEPDQELVPPAVPLGPVEVLVAGLVGDQIAAVHGAAPPLERVVQAGERLHELQRGPGPHGVHREAVELLPGAAGDVVPGELDPDVAQRAAVVGVVGAARIRPR